MKLSYAGSAECKTRGARDDSAVSVLHTRMAALTDYLTSHFRTRNIHLYTSLLQLHAQSQNQAHDRCLLSLAITMLDSRALTVMLLVPVLDIRALPEEQMGLFHLLTVPKRIHIALGKCYFDMVSGQDTEYLQDLQHTFIGDV